MLQVGEKYYTILEDSSLDIVRVVQSCKDNTQVKITRDGINTMKVNSSYLADYIKINPDGYIFFNVVNMGKTKEEGQDVVVMLHKKKDLDNNNVIPFTAVRQNIFDLFSSNAYNEDNTLLGMSMNRDGVPEGAEFTDMLACYSIDYVEKIAIYLDDRIFNILPMISNITKFDSVLYKLYSALEGDTFKGLNKTLESLLVSTHFQHDFNVTFGIIEIEEVLLYDNENSVLLPQSVNLIEDILKTVISQTYVVPFSKEVDLKNIKRDYILVRDGIMGLYIVAYDKGEYINRPYDKMGDKSELIELLRNINKK